MQVADYLAQAVDAGHLDRDIIAPVLHLCDCAKKIAKLASANGIGNAALGQLTGTENSDGDGQKALDVMADEIICASLKETGVRAYLSEERDDPVLINPDSAFVVACDPLDGSSNIDTNLTIGTIFSIYKTTDDSWFAAGRNQKVAGFFAYGPQTALLLTIGHGVAGFCLNDAGQFEKMDWQIAIAEQTSEFAINMANQRYWQTPINNYIHGLLAGADGQRGRNFNMRWAGSLVADAWRIFRRGGIFLYPQDSRKGYETGRLRLVYEAHPVAFLVEQAGGRASDGKQDIMDIIPQSFHQRVPLIFGSSEEVDRVTVAE